MTPPYQALRTPHEIRNSRAMIMAILLSSCVLFACAPCFAILALTTLSPFRTFSVQRLITLLGWAISAQASGSLGLVTWRRAMNLRKPSISVRPDGLHIRLENPATSPEQFVGWSDIRAVGYSRGGKIQFCSITGETAGTIELSSFQFLRPKAIALEIASLAGITATGT